MTTPEQREKNRQYQAAYRARRGPEWRAYKREMDRIYRSKAYRLQRKAEAFDRAWASLHDLGCRYPDEGCSCRVVLLVAS